MTPADEFKEKKYTHVQTSLTPEMCAELCLKLGEEFQRHGHVDEKCPLSTSLTYNEVLDRLLVRLLPEMEEATGLKLLPTYAFARLYNKGETLPSHKDREACEISATITLGYDGEKVWPFIAEVDGVENSIDIEVGEAIIYRGMEVEHRRDLYDCGVWQIQVFLHYVDADGPHKHWKFDKRETLASDPQKEPDHLNFWIYTDALSDSECDQIVAAISPHQGDEGIIYLQDGVMASDKKVRNVNKYPIPTYKGLGAILTAVGMDANKQRWKFDIDSVNQAEILRYPAGGGRYTEHIDTIMSNLPFAQKDCRKLTIIAFLNDDYTGGDFFLRIGSEKCYMPKKKGTIVVFPSFLSHGVEDVIEGERYSAVCWMVGPFFK